MSVRVGKFATTVSLAVVPFTIKLSIVCPNHYPIALSLVQVEITFVIASRSPNFVALSICFALNKLSVVVGFFLDLIKFIQIFSDNPVSPAIHLSVFKLANVALPFRFAQLSITIVNACFEMANILSPVRQLLLPRALFQSECELTFVNITVIIA